MEYPIFFKQFSKLSQKKLNSELNIACVGGNLKLIKYLLTSPDLKEHADVYANEDCVFKYACSFNHLDIVDFLIFEFKMEKTDNILQYLKNNNNLEIEQMFNTRDLKENLESELPIAQTNEKKIKI